MKLSMLLKKNRFINQYMIVNELEFETLALVGSDVDMMFCSFIEDEKYIDEISPNATMLFVTEKLMNDSRLANIGKCIVENPRNCFFKLHNSLSSNSEYMDTNFETSMGSNCKIHPLSSIAKTNVKIGNNVMIEEFVSIKENTIIGDDCVIRAGSRIGSEGFEFKKEEDTIFEVKHLGGVRIGNNVEIQCNSCIDKAIYPWDNTVIEDYVKIDNLVHIAHAVKIGQSSMVVANSGIGGRVTIGKNSWIGFNSSIRNGITIGNNAKVNMGSVVTKSVKDGESVTGNFAISHEKHIEHIKKISK